MMRKNRQVQKEGETKEGAGELGVCCIRSYLKKGLVNFNKGYCSIKMVMIKETFWTTFKRKCGK